MEKLESENVSLEFQVQFFIKERDNVKTEYQKLFDLIERTRTQTQGEINELIENVNQKTYTYVDVRAQNQDLLITISELKAKLKNAENVSKTRFSVKTVQSKSLDTTPVVSKTKIAAVTPLSAKHKVVQIVLWIVDSGCSKHMTGDRSLLKNFIEKIMRTVRFGNDHFTAITGYGDYLQDNITVCHVYYVEGLGHNLFRYRESNLYTISISDMAASSPVYLMSKATSTKSWLWHHRLSHLNFGTINDLTKHDLVDGILKFKYGKDHLCSICERGKCKKASHPTKLVPSNHSKLELLHMDLCGTMRGSIQSMECGAEAVSTACFTQNRLIIHTRYNKTSYELLHCRKPNVEYFHVFGSLCYLTNDRDDLGNMKPKADIGIFIGYSKTSRGFRIYNRCTKKIMETIHVKFDELTAMASEHDSLEPCFQRFINDDSSAESMNIPSKEDLDNLFGPMYEEYFEKRSSNTSINFVAQQVHNHEDSPLTSSIVVEEHEAPPHYFDGNTIFVLYNVSNFEEVELSKIALDPSNMHEFHQVQPSTHIWTKAHPLEQVIVSTLEPKIIKESMSDHSWIDSMQDELHQFERLDVWELVPRLARNNIFAVKWLWKNKSDAENIVIRNKSRLVAKGRK
ncbi:retrovirus-related pol polyprotein from transposon TNT 1-94 [Tanacetum coccineum]